MLTLIETVTKQLRTVLFLAVAVTAVTGYAAPPHPGLLKNAAAAKGAAVSVLPAFSEWHSRGICAPDDFGFQFQKNDNLGASLSPAAANFRILAILVQFSDNAASVSPLFFDSLVFGTVGNTVQDYFSEISAAQIDLVTLNLPSTIGWTTAPQTYSYYVNGQQGTGPYPTNSQGLVENLVDLVDPVVNFSNYDNDNDGDVDVLLIIHAGSGAEFSGSSSDIWSHKWAINPRLKDGVLISSYTVQPEYWISPGDMTIGIYAHELCHGFGLPDLYDTDGSSNGIGRWGIMATGSWNGPAGMGESPSYPCAWSRIQMGIATATNVTGNLIAQPLGAVETGGPIYRLWSAGVIETEYFLVENRQKLGYDSYLRGDGLLVWHIDDLKSDNNQEWYPTLPGSNHYKVSLEQADGAFELEHKTDFGDASDPFPGITNTISFTTASSPSSDKYTTGTSFVEIRNISSSGLAMSADLIVGIAVGIGDDLSTSLPLSPELSQNYPNPFNPSTTIELTLPTAGEVTLEIYNVLGQKVRTLIDGYKSSGRTVVVWNSENDRGSAMASGVYFYKLITPSQELTRKMALVR